MPAIDLHGLRVAWSTRGLARDPVARLFEPFARAEEGPSPDIDIAVATEARAPLDALDDTFRPSFFQGNVRVLTRDGAFRILAPAARVDVSRDGARIDAQVDAAAWIERGFVNTTLFIALTIALRHHGLHHLHGGAVVRGDGTRVLVLGEGGSGKSTVTMTLAGDPAALVLGDDALFVRREGDRAPALLGFPRPLHVAPATAAAFPALAPSRDERDANGKVDVPLSRLAARVAPRMDAPHVVLFPQVTPHAETRAIPIAAADAFGLALRSCALVAVDAMPAAAEQLAVMRDLLASARAFELHLGADWLVDPQRACDRALASLLL